MGTRHLQTVIAKNGEHKVRQYGQWDGNPQNQGLDILKYLRNGDLTKYQLELDKLRHITDAEIDEVNGDSNWTINYPYLSRDCGSKIHQMIEDGTVKFVIHTNEKDARIHCEGFYTIDFQKGVFISEYHNRQAQFPLDNLPDDETYLFSMRKTDND
jgi:hypothetical protein